MCGEITRKTLKGRHFGTILLLEIVNSNNLYFDKVVKIIYNKNVV